MIDSGSRSYGIAEGHLPVPGRRAGLAEVRPPEESVFLHELPPEDAQAVCEFAVPRSYRRGTALFYEGQPAEAIPLVLSGRVAVKSTVGGRELALDISGPGELIAAASAVAGKPRTGTAIALDPVDALVFPRGPLLRLAERNGRVALALARTLARRVDDAERGRVRLAAGDTLSRLAGSLIDLAERFGEPTESGIRIDLALTQEELAGVVGASHRAVTAALRQLRELGWVTTARRSVTVHDLESLRRASA